MVNVNPKSEEKDSLGTQLPVSLGLGVPEPKKRAWKWTIIIFGSESTDFNTAALTFPKNHVNH